MGVSLRRAKRPQSLTALVAYRREAALPAQVRILGLDPGSIRTGYAVVETNGSNVAYVVSGAIRTQGESFAERLQEIFTGVDQLTNEFRPDEVAIERVFMHRNADSALKLGQARGAALSATFALRPRVFEYAPREVKQAVVGTGAAEKEQVQLMVKRLLNISGPLGAMRRMRSRSRCVMRTRASSNGVDPLGIAMIGFLRGRLTAKHPPALVIDVGGVGYEIEAPMSTFYGLPAVGTEIHLFTHLVVREDAHILFGFGTERERRLFRELLKVSNVGPKLALSLLSGMSVDNFLMCIEAQDADTLVRIPGRRSQDRRAIADRDEGSHQESRAAAGRHSRADARAASGCACRSVQRVDCAGLQADRSDASVEGRRSVRADDRGNHPSRLAGRRGEVRQAADGSVSIAASSARIVARTIAESRQA